MVVFVVGGAWYRERACGGGYARRAAGGAVERGVMGPRRVCPAHTRAAPPRDI